MCVYMCVCVCVCVCVNSFQSAPNMNSCETPECNRGDIRLHLCALLDNIKLLWIMK